jgi:uncharacterized membrane protein
MNQPISQSPGSNLPWLTRSQGRIATTLVAAALACLLSWHLPEDLNLLLTYDCGVVVYLVLFCILVVRASPEDAAEISRRGEPNGALMLLAVVVLSLVSLVAVAAMLNNPGNRPRWQHNLHMTLSLLAVILSWFLTHIYFGLYYMRLYYDDTVVGGKRTYAMGLEYPENPTKERDFWDFMYYSFTIAMCYQTSDITITSERIRRVTLLHAILSFIFVSAIIGFVVNVISNII